MADPAETKLAENLVRFTPPMTVLVEGGGYPNAWIETQPMGGELYNALAAHDARLWRTRDSNGDGLLETWCVWDTGEDECTRLTTRRAPVPLVSIAINEELSRNAPRNNWSGQPQGLTWQRAIGGLENTSSGSNARAASSAASSATGRPSPAPPACGWSPTWWAGRVAEATADRGRSALPGRLLDFQHDDRDRRVGGRGGGGDGQAAGVAAKGQ